MSHHPMFACPQLLPMLGLTLLLASCDGNGGLGAFGVACPPVTPADPGTGAIVRGTVRAPASLVGDAAAPPGTEQVVPIADVSLADAAGNPIAGTFHPRTGDDGAYLVQRVPGDFAYAVIARFPGADGQEIALRTLARPGTDVAAPSDISLATTLVTMHVTEGQQGLVGTFDPAIFDKAVKRVDERLKTEPPPSLASSAAVKALVDGWALTDPELAAALAGLKEQVTKPAASPSALAAEVARTADPDPLDALRPIY